MITKASEVLATTAKLLNRSNWRKGSDGDRAKCAGNHCVRGMIYAVASEMGPEQGKYCNNASLANESMDFTRRAIARVTKKTLYGISVPGFNDKPARTLTEVKNVLKIAATIAAKEGN